MTPMAPARLLTAEEFAALPQPADGSQQELVEGVIVTMPSHSFYHGHVCVEISFKLRLYIGEKKSGVLASNDSGVIIKRNPDTVRGPDVAFWTRERLNELPRQGYPSVAPDLVVEVLSPSDVFTRVHSKVRQYLEAGVRLIWILVPEDRSIAVFRAGNQSSILTNGETLSGEDVLPGFACAVAELFP